MNVVAQTLSGWFFHHDDLRARLHALARNVFACMHRGTDLRTSLSAHVGDAPGTGLHGCAPWILTGRVAGATGRVSLGRRLGAGAAGELRTPPPARLTASGALRLASTNARANVASSTAGPQRRLAVRRRTPVAGPRIGPPSAARCEARPPDRPAPRASRSGPYAVREGDYVPYLPDLLRGSMAVAAVETAPRSTRGSARRCWRRPSLLRHRFNVRPTTRGRGRCTTPCSKWSTRPPCRAPAA